MEGIQFDAVGFLRDSTARVKFPYSHLTKSVMDGFDRLLEEPEEYLRRWTFDVDQMEEPGKKSDPDDGLVFRNGEKNTDPNMPAYDFKVVMQYTTRVRHLLRSHGVPIENHLSFLDACDELFDAFLMATLKMAKEVDARVSGSHLFPSMLRSTEHRMRLLKYPPQKVGARIGKKHKDRCTWTIHADETFPACYVKGNLIEARADDAFVFASTAFERDMGGLVPTIEAQEHEIIVPPDSAWQDKHRFAVVFFARSDR